MENILKKILPWLICLAIFFYLFKKYPVREVLEAARQVRLFPFLIYTTFYFAFMLLFDSWNLSWLFSRYFTPTKLKEILPLRLASYPLMILNYGAAQGLFAYFLKKVKKVPFLNGTSFVLFLSVVDLYCTASLAFFGSFLKDLTLGGFNVSRWVQMIWGGGTLALIVVIFVGKARLDWRVLRWVRSQKLFSIFSLAPVSDYLLVFLSRLPIHLLINSTLYFVSWSFNAPLPFRTVISSYPIVVLLSGIPITPGGLGVAQAATVELFKDFVASELLLAMSLVFTFAIYLLKTLFGSFFLRRVMKDPKGEERTP